MSFFSWLRSLFSRKRKPLVAPPQTSMSNPWGFIASPTMGNQPRLEGDKVLVELTEGKEVDMVVKPTGPLTGKKLVFSWSFFGNITPTQGVNPTASLIIIRKGNDWTAKNPNERWYWAGPTIVSGKTDVHTVETLPAYWTNVYGQKDASGFADAIANAEYVGVAFGDPGAGATAHGCKGDGTFRFSLEVV